MFFCCFLLWDVYRIYGVGFGFGIFRKWILMVWPCDFHGILMVCFVIFRNFNGILMGFDGVNIEI